MSVVLYKAMVKPSVTLGLRVRNKPSFNGSKINSLKAKTVVSVYEESGDWVRIHPVYQEWCSSQYLDKIENEELKPLESIGKVRIISKVYINVRSGAGSNFKIVGKISHGETVNIYTASSLWLRVSPTESQWIYKPLTETVGEEELNPENIGELNYLYIPYDENKGFRRTQDFGENKHWYSNAGGHNGLDWGIPPYNNIYASRKGDVIRADFNPDGYGRSVWIQHYDDKGRKSGRTIYGHLRQILVKVGDVVEEHQLIGKSGGDLGDAYRGFSTGAHLHFEYRWDKLAPQVPGGLKYNAVDPNCLLLSWDVKEGLELMPLDTAIVTADVLNVRVSNSINSNSYGGKVVYKNNKLNIYEKKNGFARINGKLNQWVSEKYLKYDKDT